MNEKNNTPSMNYYQVVTAGKVEGERERRNYKKVFTGKDQKYFRKNFGRQTKPNLGSGATYPEQCLHVSR